MTPAEEAEVLAVLEGVRGENHATFDGRSWRGTYAGNVAFLLPDGWRVVVFNDCSEWDYVSSVRAPDGREWGHPYDFPDGPSLSDRIVDWHPEDEHAAAWGLSLSDVGHG